jgi:CubicO group peptidase (beta-lactamase class C family)
MPWRRLLLLLSLFASTACAAPDANTLAPSLDRRIDAAQAAGFTGSVLVADDKGVVYERTVGEGIDERTRFNLASSGKLFTTIAVMQLVQQGKLDLDAPIGRYLPQWPVASVREQVTARQLLLHTSGLGQYWGDAFEARRKQLRTLADYQPLLASETRFTPGTQWAYSNTGFMLLGMLVEAVSGQDYYDYVAEHVFAPAGMQDTGYFDIDGVAPNVATPRRNGEALPMPEPRGGAAGGGYSTPRDLLRFHRALTSGKLLDAKTLDALFAPVTLPEGTRAPPHGLGILRVAKGDDVLYGHPGGAPGIGVDFRALRKAGWAIIVMGNSDEVRTMPLANELVELIDGADLDGADLRLRTATD